MIHFIILIFRQFVLELLIIANAVIYFPRLVDWIDERHKTWEKRSIRNYQASLTIAANIFVAIKPRDKILYAAECRLHRRRCCIYSAALRVDVRCIDARPPFLCGRLERLMTNLISLPPSPLISSRFFSGRGR